MPERTVAELLARIEDLERARSTPVPARTGRRRRLVLGVAALVALLVVPVGVFAGHQFTDVSGTNTFHAAIARVKDAGITGGCSATRYCPDTAVTRGQMAAFLARSAPRAETSWFEDVPLVSAEGVLLAELTVKAAAPGGTAAAAVAATVTVHTQDVTLCPCTGAFYIVSDSSDFGSYTQYATVTDLQFAIGATTYGAATTSITVLLPFASGVDEGVYLVGSLAGGGPLTAYGEMVATVANLDGVGGNVVLPVTTSGGGAAGPGVRGTRP